MSCRKLKAKARAEQDYWLSFMDSHDLTEPVTEEERLDFLRYDSHGGEKPRARVARSKLPFGEPYYGANPIIFGKMRHGQHGHMKGGERDGEMIRWYKDTTGGWPGGIEMVMDYLPREPFGIRPLREWFGDEAVERWLREFLRLPW